MKRIKWYRSVILTHFAAVQLTKLGLFTPYSKDFCFYPDDFKDATAPNDAYKLWLLR